MIYVTMHDYGTSEQIPRIHYNGKSIRHVRVPHEIMLAVRSGESVMFDDVVAGREWFSNAGYAIAKDQCVDASRLLDYFGLKFEKGPSVEEQCGELPKITKKLQRYLALDYPHYDKIDERWIGYAVSWLGQSQSQSHGIPVECMCGSSGQHLGDDVAMDVQRWRKLHPEMVKLWTNIDIAARCAMDSIATVSIDVAGRYKLLFKARQILPGVGALTVEMPSGHALWLPHIKLENGVLMRKGRQLTKPRLVKLIAKYIAWELHCEDRIHIFGACGRPAWVCGLLDSQLPV